ncbi:MAG TPA: DPP IV N-terminal domain-containing protein [Anaerolineales bacterium]|nr:DPP IV N-terminal domain-containing protein [Anaerolineales bacterium]
MTKYRWGVLGALSALLLGACAWLGGTGPGHIVFEGWYFDGSEDNDLWIVSGDGGGLTQLTTEGASDRSPALSPDGRRIAFVSNREGADQIYVMNVDGSAATRLTEDRDPAFPSKFDPVWSPDGTQIAFAKSDITATNTYVINADGSGHVQLTDDSVYSAEPAWSPDGRQIAFVRSDQGDTWIFVMKPDGSEPVNLTAQYPDSWAPTWSADGRQIAFVTYSNGSPEIFIMSAGAADAHKLTSLDALGMGPIDLSWGP